MLATEKDNLLAETNLRIARLRDKELAYYVNHMGSIQTIATLVAGFSFSALVKMDATLDMNMLLFMQSSGSTTTVDPATGVSISTPIVRQIDAAQIFAFLMQLGELSAVILTLGEMLHVLTDSLVSRLLGTRLALRGPDGSIIRATKHLANALEHSTRLFFNGLQYFLASIIFHVLRSQHPSLGVWAIVLLFPCAASGLDPTSSSHDVRASVHLCRYASLPTPTPHYISLRLCLCLPLPASAAATCRRRCHRLSASTAEPDHDGSPEQLLASSGRTRQAARHRLPSHSRHQHRIRCDGNIQHVQVATPRRLPSNSIQSRGGRPTGHSLQRARH